MSLISNAICMILKVTVLCGAIRQTSHLQLPKTTCSGMWWLLAKIQYTPCKVLQHMCVCVHKLPPQHGPGPTLKASSSKPAGHGSARFQYLHWNSEWVPLRKIIKPAMFGSQTPRRLPLVITLLLEMTPLAPWRKMGQNRPEMARN